MPKKKIESVIIRPDAKRYGQGKDFDMFLFLQNEFDNQRIRAQLTASPFDVVDKMNQQTSKLDNLRAAAINVLTHWEKGDLAAAVRELDAAVKESQR
jgi:hypothetical protein